MLLFFTRLRLFLVIASLLAFIFCPLSPFFLLFLLQILRNLVLHGIEDFQIAREDTLRDPAFTDGAGGLATFDCVIANPPFSLKEWGREVWENDPWGRAQYGLPPDGYGDYRSYLITQVGSDVNSVEDLRGKPHGWPVRLASHHDGDLSSHETSQLSFR